MAICSSGWRYMNSEPQLEPRSRLIWGLLCVLLSAVLAVLIFGRPQKLSAPAWVAYSAAAAFLIAGLLLVAGAANANRVQNWLAVVLLGFMVLPAMWIAFGAGPRQCTASLPIPGLASDIVCRSVFGLGALIGLGVLMLYVAHAIRGQAGRR